MADRTPENRNRLVEAYLPLVRRIALAFAWKMAPYVTAEELFGVGSEGLMHAVERFEPSREVQFHTYATHIVRFAILDGLRENDWLPRLERYRVNQGKAKPVEMIPMSVYLSVDEERQEDPLAFATYDRVSTTDEWAALLRGLSKRERLLVLLYYRESLTFREISQQLGLTESRVCQLHQSILKRLREAVDQRRFVA